MPSRFRQYLKHLALPFVLLVIAATALGTTGVLADASDLPFGATSACACASGGGGLWVIEASPVKLKGKSTVTFTVRNETGAFGEVKQFNFGGAGFEFTEVSGWEFKLCEGGYVDKGFCEFKFQYSGNAKATFYAEIVDGNKVAYQSPTVTGEP